MMEHLCVTCQKPINRINSSPRVNRFFCRIQCAIDYAMIRAETASD